MLKKITQKHLLTLFFAVFALNGSALAACDLADGTNVTYRNLDAGGVANLSLIARRAYIVAACNAGVEFQFDSNDYRCVTSNSGQRWLDRNLGAARPCAAIDDQQCRGDYYQWGRNKDGHQRINSNTVSRQLEYDDTSSSDFITRPDWSFTDTGSSPLRSARWAATDGSSICPLGFRVPTAAHLTAELQSWSADTTADIALAFASPLKWATTGQRISQNGEITAIDEGYAWSADIQSSSPLRLVITADAGSVNSGSEGTGIPVRCILAL